MADTKRINVVRTKPSAVRLIANQVIFWTILVGAIGLSKVWFGGSWIIDIVSAFMAFAMMFALGARHVGREADMTKEQVAAWVAAGQPDDVKTWKERANG